METKSLIVSILSNPAVINIICAVFVSVGSLALYALKKLLDTLEAHAAKGSAIDSMLIFAKRFLSNPAMVDKGVDAFKNYLKKNKPDWLTDDEIDAFARGVLGEATKTPIR